MEYEIPQETSKERIISYPHESGIEEYSIPYEQSTNSSQSEDSKLTEIVNK